MKKKDQVHYVNDEAKKNLDKYYRLLKKIQKLNQGCIKQDQINFSEFLQQIDELINLYWSNFMFALICQSPIQQKVKKEKSSKSNHIFKKEKSSKQSYFLKLTKAIYFFIKQKNDNIQTIQIFLTLVAKHIQCYLTVYDEIFNRNQFKQQLQIWKQLIQTFKEWLLYNTDTNWQNIVQECVLESKKTKNQQSMKIWTKLLILSKFDINTANQQKLIQVVIQLNQLNPVTLTLEQICTNNLKQRILKQFKQLAKRICMIQVAQFPESLKSDSKSKYSPIKRQQNENKQKMTQRKQTEPFRIQNNKKYSQISYNSQNGHQFEQQNIRKKFISEYNIPWPTTKQGYQLLQKYYTSFLNCNGGTLHYGCCLLGQNILTIGIQILQWKDIYLFIKKLSIVFQQVYPKLQGFTINQYRSDVQKQLDFYKEKYQNSKHKNKLDDEYLFRLNPCAEVKIHKISIDKYLKLLLNGFKSQNQKKQQVFRYKIEINVKTDSQLNTYYIKDKDTSLRCYVIQKGTGFLKQLTFSQYMNLYKSKWRQATKDIQMDKYFQLEFVPFQFTVPLGNQLNKKQ